MPHYVTLVRYTQQGISKIKESPSRLDTAEKAAEAEGGKIREWFFTMGQYDAVLISEFPNDESCAKFALSAGCARKHIHGDVEGVFRGRVSQNPRLSQIMEMIGSAARNVRTISTLM